MENHVIGRVSIEDKESGMVTPIDARTRAEAVDTKESGRSAQDKFDEFDAHIANEAIHSDAYIKPMWQVTIPNTEWVKAAPEETDFPYCIEIAYNGVLDTHNAEVTVDRGSIGTAWECGLCPTMETMHNGLKFWARKIPEDNILCHMTLFGAGGINGGEG